MNKKRKKEYGQFFSKNAEYIFEGFPKAQYSVVEPFYGDGDLVKKYENIEAYDIFPKNNNILKRDTLLNPPSYKGKTVITNPPYLASNKTKKHKRIFNKWQTNDLYKAFLLSLICDPPNEGMIIIPLNFFCDRDHNLRKQFLEKFEIKKVNIFEEKVFSDTDYIVCSLWFLKKEKKNKKSNLNCVFFPTKEKETFLIEEKNNYIIGGDFIKSLPKTKIKRLTEKNKNGFVPPLVLRATDGGGKNNRISLLYNNNPFIGKNSDRTFCSFLLEKERNVEWPLVIKNFNEDLEKQRKIYRSLFLTNYRTSTKFYSRKRIDFKIAFALLEKHIQNFVCKGR